MQSVLRTYFKTDGKFKEIMKGFSKPIEVCEALKQYQNNPYNRFVKQYFESKLPSLTHQCPYSMVKI